MSPVSTVIHLEHLATQIKAKHALFTTRTREAIKLAVEIGVLLKAARGSAGHGDWGQFVETCGLSRMTAWRYIRVHDDWDSKAGQLERGLMLCDVYRSIGLLPEVQGGGARLGKDELSRRRTAEQLVFHFDRVEAGIREMARFTENPLLDHLESLEIGRLQEDCKAAERAAQYYREAVEAKQRTITV